MIVCEDCVQIITAKTFWLHKHSNYATLEVMSNKSKFNLLDTK